MTSISEEERVLAVLSDLRSRKESEGVREDIEKLERLLKDPLFRQYSSKSAATRPTVERKERDIDLLESLREEVEDELRNNLTDNQKLHFVDFDGSVKPIVLDTREPKPRLLVVGPKNIKSRSAARIRIGDRIQVVATRHACHSVEGTNQKGGGASQKDTNHREIRIDRGPSKTQFETICDEAERNNSFVAVAIIRETTAMVLSGDWTQVEVIRLSTEAGGLGFGIVGGTSTGVVVKTILPGSPADKDGRLRPGDHILQIGHVSTHGMSSQQVATILRQQDVLVEMIVGRPIIYSERPADTNDCWTMSTRSALSAAALEEHIHKQTATTSSTAQTSTTISPSTSNLQDEEVGATSSNGQLPTTPQASSVRKTSRHSISQKEAPDLGKETTSQGQQESRKSSQVSRKISQTPTCLQPLGEVNTPAVIPNGATIQSTEPPTPTTTRISLRSLQEMALTVFLRENWEHTPYERVEVELTRDPALGLGITVAGYVHRKEEIGGIFVKSLVPRSAASHSNRIRIHDLILKVNDTSLEHLSHADSVRTLVKSGDVVSLLLIRFPPESSQAQCLKMLQEQETDTQVIDVQSSNPDLVAEWKRKLSNDIDIISAVVRPDRKTSGDGGLGISLEGTVDVIDGHQLCPHHYIESLRKDGPASKTGLLQAGDELLQVNHSPLFGESHVTVRQALSRAAHTGAPVTLIVARRKQHFHLFQPSGEGSLPLSYPMLAAGHDRTVKAKSEICIPTCVDTDTLLQQVSRRLRSRSLEPLTGLAVWNCIPLIITLEKDARGLGFSIVDYQDPSHPGETVIVVQSLVPGGLAQADGRIVPGDRLVFVNQHDLSNSSLERAVAVLKAAPMGKIRIGIAKPVPIDQCLVTSHSPIITRSERLLARGSSPRGRRRRPSGVTSSQETVWIGAENHRKLHPQGYYPSRSPSCSRSERSLDGSDLSMASWSPCSTRSMSPAGSPLSLRGSWAYDVIFLPSHLERTIKMAKGSQALGIVLDADKDKGVNGCTVKSICGKKAIAQDGRIQVGDYIVKINQESLRNATSSQSRAILKRTNLMGNQCTITYITSADAQIWKERFHKESEPQPPVINRLSPRIFPKFYRSPYVSRKSSLLDHQGDDTEPPSEAEDLIESNQNLHSEPWEPEQERCSAGRFVDGFHLEQYACEIFEVAFRDALLDLVVSSQIADWTGKPPLPKTPSLDRSIGLASSPSLDALKTKVGEVEDQKTESVEEEPSTSFTLRSEQTSPSEKSETSTVNRHKEEFSRQNSKESKDRETPVSRKTSKTSQVLLRRDSEPASSRPLIEEKLEIEDRPPEEAEESNQPSTSRIEDNREHVVNEEEMKKAEEEISTIPSSKQKAKQLVRSKFWGEAREVTLHREPNKSFGISIVGGRVEVSQKGGLPGTGNTVAGIFIKSVLPQSPAGKSGMINMGDRVISVNDIDLREATHEQAVTAIKNATNPVKFILQSLHSFTPQQNMISSASNSTVGSIRIECAKPDEPVIVRDTPSIVADQTSPSEQSTSQCENHLASCKPTTPPPSIKTDQAVRMEDVTPPETPVTIDNVIMSLEEKEEPTKEKTGSRSSRQNSVGRESLDGTTKRDSVKKKESIKKKDSKRRDEQRKESYASGPLIVSDVSSSETHEEEYYPEIPAERQKEMILSGIEENSAAFLMSTPDDTDTENKYFYTKKKAQRKYGHLGGDILLVECGDVPEAGLGISLAGNKDRDKLSVFVVSVRVACPLPIRAGDELLEVNGRLLTGLSHVTASSRVKQCCETGSVSIILRRKDGALSECAVKPGDMSIELDAGSPTGSAMHSIHTPLIEPPGDGTMQNIESLRKKSFTLERTTAIEVGKETLIEIDKDGKGLGLSIVGGSDTVLGTVVIHEVYPDGAAAHDGRLKPGDQVLEVNNVSLRGVTHDQAISCLRRTPPKVRLMIYRDVNLQLSLLDPTQIYNMFEVELVKKAGRGLGLSIVGRKNEPGVYVSEVVKGGAAEADGTLMTGDQILAVNGQDVANSMQEDVAAMLKTCVGKVHLKLGRWKITETANRVHAAAEAAGNTAVSPSFKHEEIHACTSSEREREVPPPAPPSRPLITHTPPEGEAQEDPPMGLSPVTEEPSSGADQRSIMEEERIPSNTLAMDILHNLKEEGSDTLLLELKKIPDQQLGMGIGKRTRGILVTSLQPGSSAAEKLKVGDRILAVNALPVSDQLSAVTFVKASGERLYLQIARPRASPT